MGQESQVDVDEAGTVVQVQGEGASALSSSTTVQDAEGSRHVEVTFPPGNEYGLSTVTLTLPLGSAPSAC